MHSKSFFILFSAPVGRICPFVFFPVPKRFIVFVLAFWTTASHLVAQVPDDRISDSLFIAEVEERKEPYKVLHAEPLFIDLIRDLGARKGEREWNVGMGLTDNQKFDRYEALVEYEWAPIDRLGLEIELPFTFYYPLNGDGRNTAPGDRLNGLKTAAQWTFWVSEKHKTSLALGYLNELEFVPFRDYNKGSVFYGNIFNPFFVGAKRLSSNWHALIYTGPEVHYNFRKKGVQTEWHINSNVHYMISGTRNFIGLEANKSFGPRGAQIIVRPQMRLCISDNLMIGIVAGVPISRQNERFSTFFRIIYEPPHH